MASEWPVLCDKFDTLAQQYLTRAEKAESELARLREELSHFGGYVATCRAENTLAWLDHLAERLTEMSALVHGNDTFHFSRTSGFFETSQAGSLDKLKEGES